MTGGVSVALVMIPVQAKTRNIRNKQKRGSLIAIVIVHNLTIASQLLYAKHFFRGVA